MRRWSQDRDVPKLKYEPALDPKGRGWHYVWEGGGFGVQVFKSGKRKWMQCGSLKDPLNGQWKSYFRPLGDVADIKMADARAEGWRVKVNARQRVALRRDDAAPTPSEVHAAAVSRLMPIGKPRSQAELQSDLQLANSSLEDVLRYYEANRNCAPVSKSSMASLVRRHLSMCDRWHTADFSYGDRLKTTVPPTWRQDTPPQRRSHHWLGWQRRPA
jgi:hypothetical protein